MPDSMSTEERIGYYLIRIAGRFSVATAGSIKAALKDALSKKYTIFVFDVAGTIEFDSTAVSVLTSLYKEVTPKGGEVCIAAAADRLKRTMEVTGVNSVVRHFDSLAKAEKEFESPVRTEDRGFYFYVSIPDIFDILVVQPLRAELDKALAAGHKNILFDLSETRQITSVGIGVLMNLKKKMGRESGGVYLLNVGTNISALLHSANVSQLLPRFNSLEEAERELI